MSGPILLYRLVVSCLGQENITGIKVLGDYLCCQKKNLFKRPHKKENRAKKKTLKYRSSCAFASFKKNAIRKCQSETQESCCASFLPQKETERASYRPRQI